MTFSMHVPTAIKQRICKGDYINPSLLLNGAVELSDYANSSSILVLNNSRLENRPTECKDDIGTIEQWTDAFIIKMDVYLSANPHKTHELLHYSYTIRECATNQEGIFWNNMINSSEHVRRSCCHPGRQ